MRRYTLNTFTTADVIAESEDKAREELARLANVNGQINLSATRGNVFVLTTINVGHVTLDDAGEVF